MARAILESKETVYIMGVSLREFSKMKTPVSKALRQVHERESKRLEKNPQSKKPLDIRMLILNNRSEEALRRSSIEEKRKFTSHDDPEYKIANLFRDTRDTIIDINSECPEIQLRIYDNLSLFLLVTDNMVFLEPYHSGVESVGKRPLKDDDYFERLAELVPMIEFRREPERGPYEQFRNHFEYLWEGAKPPSEENYEI